MDWKMILTVGLTLIATLSGALLGWTGRAREARKDAERQATEKANTAAVSAAAEAALRLDMEYIKRGIDDIRAEQRASKLRADEQSEQIVRVDESCKQAHKRIDALERIVKP